nr:extracellular solute-binding protein [Ktedonobacterales bacterium]
SKSILKANNIRIPTGPSDAWTADEFTQAMKTLQTHGFAKPLDVKLNYGKGEWYTYGFSPIVESAGGDLINRTNYQSADGALNSSNSVSALTTFQSWFKSGLVDRNEDDNAFKSGRSAFSWVGFWEFPNYQKTYGDDLTLVPLPNFGSGSKTGMGSWQWGITSKASSLDAAWSFVNYTIQVGPELALTKLDGAIPSRKSAISLSPQFAQGGTERLYIDQLLGTTAVPRPQTPAYPTITTAYAQALQDIIDGKDVKASLDTAVKTINQDIQDNQGYPNN